MSSPPSSLSLRVVVADPDREQRTSIVEAVRAAAKELGRAVAVDQAGDGTTALAMCSDHRPHLVVSEVLLEGLSGFDLLRRLKAEFGERTQVVFVTNMARETDRYWGLRNGALAYLTKPLDAATLQERVRRALAEGPEAKPDRPG